MWFTFGLACGLVLALPSIMVVRCAVDATLHTVFDMGAHMRYATSLPWRQRPYLFRWPVCIVGMWVRVFLFGEFELTEITFRDGTTYRKGWFGIPIRSGDT